MSNKNELHKATSPYLLQHAENPVHWVEWSERAFERAEKENKLVLVSVGYSACHWCHVMEHESFEDDAVAELMNEHFICIKVDREERPDVDQVYMNAVQLMTQQGGWPLNCFTLPDGRPIYGGTYFPMKQWMNVLSSLWDTYTEEPEKVEDYAKKLCEGVQLSEMIEVQDPVESFNPAVLESLVQKWKRNFDFDEGGDQKAPKFPLPNNYEFLLQYGVIKDDKTLINHVLKSLKKMAQGGIYDQIQGGFSRYSVDAHWKVPHFEKMLYDNGQLLSLYSDAYKYTRDPEFKRVILQTIEWLNQDLHDHARGGYYAALDADSEGVEGKYYTWTVKELQQILGDDYDWARKYYNINELGYWENNQYILLRRKDDAEFAQEHQLEDTALQEIIDRIHEKLMRVRANRIPPGLDDKKITAWNALLLKGLVDAGTALQNESLIRKAGDLANWIQQNVWDPNEKRLLRIEPKKNNKIFGFLDDYALSIECFIRLFEITGKSEHIEFAQQLTECTIHLFGDPKTSFFFYTEENSGLIARKMEINDNVIPASNSIMAKNLYKLGTLLGNLDYTSRSRMMLSSIYDQMPGYGSGYSNWAQLGVFYTEPFKEIAIVGNSAIDEGIKLQSNYLPNTLFAMGTEESIPLLKGRKKEGKTLFYVCEDQHCKSPVTSIKAVLEYL